MIKIKEEEYKKKMEEFWENYIKYEGKFIIEKAYNLLRDDEFFRAYMPFFGERNKLKRLVIEGVGLKGEVLWKETIDRLIDYLDYILLREPEFVEKREKFEKDQRKK